MRVGATSSSCSGCVQLWREFKLLIREGGLDLIHDEKKELEEGSFGLPVGHSEEGSSSSLFGVG